MTTSDRPETVETEQQAKAANRLWNSHLPPEFAAKARTDDRPDADDDAHEPDPYDTYDPDEDSRDF